MISAKRFIRYRAEKKAKNKEIISYFQESGQCIVDIDIVVKQWGVNWCISQWGTVYRMFAYPNEAP